MPINKERINKLSIHQTLLIHGAPPIQRALHILGEIDPFVLVHKGMILQESLPGLMEFLVYLWPTELRKSLLRIASESKSNFFQEVSSVSMISMHPCLVAEDQEFSAYKTEIEKIKSFIDAGVKMKFFFQLIRLADSLNERVLMFTEFLDPLVFIKQQLESQLSWNEGREILYMDGKLNQHQRQNSIRHFNNVASDAKVLLFCCADQPTSSNGKSKIEAKDKILEIPGC